jgi:hypothetical protein
MLTAWALQHYRNEIQDTILHHAPDSFTWDECDEVEGLALAEAKRVVATLTPVLLRNVRYMNKLIDDAVAETIRLCGPGNEHEDGETEDGENDNEENED